MQKFLKLLLAMAAATWMMAASDAAQADDGKVAQLTKGMTQKNGLFTIYHNDQRMLLRIPTASAGKNYMVITSIAKGISSGPILGGMSWNESVWTFKKVGTKLHVISRNVRYKAKSGTPEADAVKLAYSDSVLYALPIIDEAGGYLVDVTRIFMSDDEQVGRGIGPGFRFSSDRSTWAKVNAFPKNVELQVAAVYSGGSNIETVEDSRGVQVNVHYSISLLPENGYKPRLADDRVGYFLTVQKNFSDKDDDDQFVRFINRWNLQKADPTAALSPPKEPIIFYMEKTVPIRLRPYVRAGILEWNKAFEKIGIANAIEVRQQRNDDTWDPEDVRYNTFRWITADAGFAMGPSRVNPLTGQILDADIIFDASFLKYWSDDYETLTEAHVHRVLGYHVDETEDEATAHRGSYADIFGSRSQRHAHGADCQLCNGMNHQMSFAAAALTLQGVNGADSKGKLSEEFIHQALKEVVMHEVGHTLGLRHNFKASGWKTMKEINETTDPNVATVASVMDYSPANIVAPGEKQGLFYTQTIGPYDYWVIEYGYKPFAASKEKEELKKIASRGASDGLDYATDEDTRSSGSDPFTNRFDLGKDSLKYIDRQMTVTQQLLPKIAEKVVDEGDGYQRARRAFGMLLSEYWSAASFASRFPGGVAVHRDHKGDPDARMPFEVIDAKLQRDAMNLLVEKAFTSPQYDPELLNLLAASRWSHWGARNTSRVDYPIHETVERMQGMILGRLLSSSTLQRLRDNELKVASDADAYTLAEHLTLLTDGIFGEWLTPGKKQEYSNREPMIDSFRRNLQRQAMRSMASLVTSSSAPEDARTLARMHLQRLDSGLTSLLKQKNLKVDDYTKAHLMDAQARIQQVLNAELEVNSIR